MGRLRKQEVVQAKVRNRTANTPDARENQLISLAIDLAERQLMEGTASSQVIAHFLKLGSSKERLEQERLKEENKLLRAKTEALQSSKDIKELYDQAMKCFKRYSGDFSEETVDEEYD